MRLPALLPLALVLPAASCVIHAPPDATSPVAATAPGDGAGQPARADADGGEAVGPQRCAGNDTLELVGVVIDGPDVAVEARGNCAVVLTNCAVRAGGVGISLHGNASLTMTGGSIEAPRAVDAHGNASATISGAQVRGDVDQHGNATVVVR